MLTLISLPVVLDYSFLQVKETLFPCKLSHENAKLVEEAVQMATKTWGQKSLTELEAEERLSYSCEKVMKQVEHDWDLLFNVSNT